MSKISFIKGARTRFRNILEKEIRKAKELLADDTGCALDDKIISATTCLEKIKVYCEKVESQGEKLASEIDVDDDSLQIDTILNEDCDLCSVAMDAYFGLKEFKEGLIVLKEKENTMKVVEEDSNTKQILKLQQNMQELFAFQMKQQEQSLKKQAEQTSAVKLPKMEMTSFNGDKTHWFEFWESFKSAVHENKSISNVDKFNYLKSKIHGEAKAAIAGLSLTSENYPVAIDILSSRFGNVQEIIDLHYNRLINMHVATNKIGSLRDLLDKMERHLRSLEVLNQKIDQGVFISIVRSKLPEDVLVQLEVQKGVDKKWTVSDLCEQLRQYVVARERASKDAKANESNSDSNVQSAGRNKGADKKGNQANHDSGSAQALINTTAKVQQQKRSYENNKRCRYCEGQHWSDQCSQYKTISDRKERIKGSCYKCLKEGHFFKECKSNRACIYCGEMNVHHRSLCPKKFLVKTTMSQVVCEQEAEVENADEGGLMSMKETVLMQTALTEIKDPNKVDGSRVRLLFDSGSHRSYITQSLARKLGLKEEGEQVINVVTFGSKATKQIKTTYTNLEVKLKDGSFIKLTVNVVPFISGELQRKPIKDLDSEKVKNVIESVVLADVIPKSSETCPIELLISNDYYIDFMLEEKIRIQNGLYLLASKLGWILSGRLSDSCDDSDEPNMLVMTYGSKICATSDRSPVDSCIASGVEIEDFWNLETIGIVDKKTKSEDQMALESFQNSLQFHDGRYYVTWPWKEEEPDLPVNRELALGRLKTSVNRMRFKVDILKRYDDVIQDQLQKGVIEKVQTNEVDGIVHYIPHHAVITPQKTTTKLRIVYDASAKTRKENNSLNECLYRGPVLLHDLSGMLMRFRTHPIVLVADIEKAFLQIGLQKDQRDVTRFLWLKDIDTCVTGPENIQEYRLTRVPFGVIASPFLLGATINYHLDTYESDIANKIKGDIYVDNLIAGTTTAQEATELYKNAKRMFSEGSMNLREWISNVDEVSSCFAEKDRADVEVMKVLGHNWDRRSDTLSFNEVANLSQPVTKRLVLKHLASIFDPLGLICPIIVPGKVFLQDLWREKLDWDDPLDSEKNDKWNLIKSNIDQLHEINVPRCICREGVNGVYQLACFCDASEKAYSAVIYLREHSDKGFETNLLFSKSRLAPVKQLSIPRLELMAVVIGLRCLEFVQKHLKMEITQTYLWTDSQCVLAWINSGNKLPVFVRNRVDMIKEFKDVTLSYVRSRENPADISAKGMSTQKLKTCELWWKGPKWLAESEENWKRFFDYENHAKMESTEESSSVQDVSNETDHSQTLIQLSDKSEGLVFNTPLGIEIERFSSLTKLLRVTALAVRFIRKLRGVKFETQSISRNDIKEAESMWLKKIQLSHFKETIESIDDKSGTAIRKQLGLFLDPDTGLLRCKSRMEFAELCEGARRPILLPKKDKFTNLVIQKVHQELVHSGVAQTLSAIRLRFWVPQGRATVMSVLKGCTVCRRYEGGPYKMPPMCPLPSFRVTEAIAFTRVGLDYLGPLYVKSSQESKKVWVCLFTCLVTRAVHLELVTDMSTAEFLLCFRRFLSQRGTPCEVISDNALQFHSADTVLRNLWKKIADDKDVLTYVSNSGINWTFNVELAPWMGGFYERLVGLVKRSLKKTVGRKLLTVIQLQTLLKEIESVLNSRPLVYVTDDINSSIPLTPAHFLTVNPKIGFPELETSDDPDFLPQQNHREKLIQMWKKGQKLLDSFWRIWRNEYLTSLRERTQSKLKCGRVSSEYQPNVNDVVIIKDDTSSGSWRFGKIVKLMKSRDGLIRSAKVELSSKRTLQRPLNLLYPLETSSDGVVNKQENSEKITENGNQGDKSLIPKRVAATKALQKIKAMKE